MDSRQAETETDKAGLDLAAPRPAEVPAAVSAPLPGYPAVREIVDQQAAWARASKRPVERVDLSAALGRVLAQAVSADRDQPPFHRSTRDGYAVRVEDANRNGWLRVVGSVRAGEVPLQRVQMGDAVEIMTGAPLPLGASCVVMLEHVERSGTTRIRPGAPRQWTLGENIVPAGAEARAGSGLLRSGARIRAQEVAVMAANGYTYVNVYARPRVAVISTGDELVEIDQRPMPHQIRNSNSHSVAAQVRTAGGEAVVFPIVRDAIDSLHLAIDAALGFDLLLLSGGVSAGRYDLVEKALAGRGARFFFTGAAIQPGKPIVFGQMPRGEGPLHLFGLPGNPVSTMVTFALFVHPVLDGLAGADPVNPRFALARLAADWQGRGDLTRFLPARWSCYDEPSVTLVPWQGSGDLRASAIANCYAVFPQGRDSIPAGEAIRILVP